MSIEVTIFGFGDERPPAFQNADRLELDLELPATPMAVLLRSGFDDQEGLALLINDRIVHAQDWQHAIVGPGDQVKVLSAIEGG
ncbi:MAG: thiamine biosynthesis protein ThiS [Planctomycetota bacterium]|jgi:thiamine biosynthesis protein ThiS